MQIKVSKSKAILSGGLGILVGAAAKWLSDQNKAWMSITAALGMAGAAVAALLGGWDTALQTLVGFMGADYITGFVVAAVFHKSGKTEGGALSSAAGLRGLFKKGGMLLLVYVACRLDLLTGTDYIRDATVIALVTNETVSITENLGLMGVPGVGIVKQAIEVLKNKGDK